jgi:transposase
MRPESHDRHKCSHTAVSVDDMGRQGATKTVGTTTRDHLRLLQWAASLDGERLWAIEDCRHLTRRLERDLIAAGESVVRVCPKLMADVRDSARTYGKSDPIDALAVARAALREPDLPVARLDGVERELRLLVDQRTSLPSALASSLGCAGTCTNSTRVGHHGQRWSAPALLTQ